VKYAASPQDWDKVVAVCKQAGRIGFDTETYGHDIRKTSAPHRARIHVWSLAVPTPKLSPRGFHRARGVMLPAAALEYFPVIELLEDPDVVKLAHNLPHDHHSVANHGITLGGGEDTLHRARLMFPEEASHSLKPLLEFKTGRRVITFEDVVSEPNEVKVVKSHRRRECTCGTPKCRRHKTQETTHPDGTVTVVEHIRAMVEWTEETTKVRGIREMPLESIVPGHPRFDLLTRYAIQDAEGVLELDEYMTCVEPRVMKERGDVEIPWT
jgi:DNA polymerase I-like protein with 3'-5' exonuclease and polymerase domains